MEIEATFTCVHCFQLNETVVDTSGGSKQSYIEDCQVCCRPNRLNIVVDAEAGSAKVDSDFT